MSNMIKEQFAWKDPRFVPPPHEGHGMAVLVTVTCQCGRGGRTTLPAGRINGEWVIGHFDHAFEIDYWIQLPEFPTSVLRR